GPIFLKAGNLTVEQFAEVKTLYKTKLDPTPKKK
ncbi:unnamed protein product, partial [marine sediment metagenome]